MVELLEAQTGRPTRCRKFCKIAHSLQGVAILDNIQKGKILASYTGSS